MITWAQFEQRQPALAAAGREHLCHFGVGLGFLATVRKDGGCPATKARRFSS